MKKKSNSPENVFILIDKEYGTQDVFSTKEELDISLKNIIFDVVNSIEDLENIKERFEIVEGIKYIPNIDLNLKITYKS